LDRSKAGEGAEAAVGSGDHPLAPDEVREALDTLGDELRVLDVVGRGGEDSRDQDLVLGYLRSLEYGPLVRVARIGRLEEQRLRLRPENDRQQPLHRHVVVM